MLCTVPLVIYRSRWWQLSIYHSMIKPIENDMFQCSMKVAHIYELETEDLHSSAFPLGQTTL